MPYFTETLLPVSVSAKGRGEGSASDLERALRMLDQTVPLDTHRIGVIYVKDGQTAESDILANASGSARYLRFLESLGEITRLRDAPEAFTGGLDVKEDRDGEFSFCYRHGITSVGGGLGCGGGVGRRGEGRGGGVSVATHNCHCRLTA